MKFQRFQKITIQSGSSSHSQQDAEQETGVSPQQIINNRISIMRREEQAVSEEQLSSSLQDVDELYGLMQRQDRYSVSLSLSDLTECDEEIISLLEYRNKMSNWAHMVTKFFGIPCDIASITINYLDRFMHNHYRIQADGDGNDDEIQEANKIDTQTFRLAALGALFLSIKIHYFKNFPLEKLLQLSRGEFTEKDVHTIEVYLMQHLHWLLHPPIAQNFVRSYAKLLGSACSQQIEDLAICFSELADSDYRISFIDPSAVALACFLNACQMHGHSTSNMLSILETKIIHEGELLEQLLPTGKETGPTNNLKLSKVRIILWKLYEQADGVRRASQTGILSAKSTSRGCASDGTTDEKTTCSPVCVRSLYSQTERTRTTHSCISERSVQ